jgi:ribosome biogenesis GTPase
MSWLFEPERGAHDLDESDVRIRANNKKSKPRTKQRPEHSDAALGMVIAVDRARYKVLLNDDSGEVTATLAKELRNAGAVVGDIVSMVGDVSNADGALARIIRVEERKTLLRRSADDSDQVERAIVANATQLMIVTAIANPEPRTRLIDRYLAAAFDAGLQPILCITKTDLADAIELVEHFAGLDIPVVLTRSDSPSTDKIHELLDGQITVVVGHSGVGKSTLVNALVPTAMLATGNVNAVTGRGRHTSSSVRAIALPNGFIIDTPGVRSFGLGHVKFENLLKSFADLWAIAKDCPRDCSHLLASPDCALDDAIAAGTLGQSGAMRVDSLRRLMDSALKADEK